MLRHDVVNKFLYLTIEVPLAIVDDFVVGTAQELGLWPLALHPLECLLTGDAVTLHDALDTYLFWCSDHNDTVYQFVGS